MAILNFKYGTGTPSAYEQGTVYVSTDNKKVYVGNPGGTGGFCIGDFIEVSVTASKGQQAALKALKGPQQNVLYLTYNATDGYDLWKYNGTDFINLTKTGEILSLISALTEVVQDINTTVEGINTDLSKYVLKSEAPGYNNILTETEAADKYYEKTVIDNKFTDLKGTSTKTLKELEDAAAAAQTMADTAKGIADGAAQGVVTLTNKIGSIEEGTTVKAYVDQAKQGAIDAAKTAADAAYPTKEDFNTLAGSVNSLGSALGSTNSNLESNFLKKADAANTYATKDDENTRETTMRGGYAGTLKEINDLASAAKSKADTNEGNLATLTTTVSGYGTRLTDVEGVADAAMPKSGGTFTGPINLPEVDPTENTQAVHKKYVDDQDAATLNAAKEDAAKNYATKETVNTLTSNVNDHIANAEQVYLKQTSLPNIDKIAYTTGATFTGEVILAGAPDKDNEAANKKYVDDVKTYANNTFATKETVSTLDSKVDDLIEDIGSLSNIMNFVGVTTSTLTDGATTKPIVVGGSNHTQEIGDVVIYDATEFVWNGTKWEKIGNTSAETEALADLDERVDKLEAKTANSSELVKAVDKNTSDIGALDSRLDQAELDIEDLQGQLTWGTFTSL